MCYLVKQYLNAALINTTALSLISFYFIQDAVGQAIKLNVWTTQVCTHPIISPTP